MEDNHFKEELDRRIEPHSHKKDNNKINIREKDLFDEKDEIRENIKVATYKKFRINIYLNKNYKSRYKINKNYLSKNEFTIEENSKQNLDFSHEYEMPEYEEFMIEKTPIGSIKAANFYRTNAGMLKKLGLMPDYNINIFSRY